jgi:hypothetical protein
LFGSLPLELRPARHPAFLIALLHPSKWDCLVDTTEW